jgi:hypothetical protein
MNKAFTKESDADDPDDGDLPVPELPAGARNYITPAGYRRLRAELLDLLDSERPKMVEVVSWAAKNDQSHPLRCKHLHARSRACRWSRRRKALHSDEAHNQHRL